MSDFKIPRVGTGGYVPTEEDRLRAEVERLRALVQVKQDSEALLVAERKDLKAEVERLREDAEKWRSTVADAEKTYAYVARLHRIEEAARVFVDNQPGTRLAPEFEAAWIDLRAALEEEA